MVKVIILLLAFASSLDPVTASPPTSSNSKRGISYPGFGGLKTLFVFGDSLSSTHFTDSTGVLPSAENPLGHPAYPGLTSCFGENWVDVLTTKFNKNLVTWNFAFDGATVNKTITPQYDAKVHDMDQQVRGDFIDNCTGPTAKVRWTATDALFLVFLGHNDLGILLQSNQVAQGQTVDQFVAYAEAQTLLIVASYFQNLDLLYASGARNFIAMAVSALQFTPFIRGVVKQASATYGPDSGAQVAKAIEQLVVNFNNQIFKNAGDWMRSHANANVYVFDSYRVMTDVVYTPSALGFVNNDGFCPRYAGLITGQTEPRDDETFAACGGLRLNQYMWLNAQHPTYPYHTYLANQLYAKLKDGYAT